MCFELFWELYSEAYQGQLMQEHLVEVHSSAKYHLITSIYKIKHLHDTCYRKQAKEAPSTLNVLHFLYIYMFSTKSRETFPNLPPAINALLQEPF